jgi:signal transduction histidine kinase
MKRNITLLSARYSAALRMCLKAGSASSVKAPLKLGRLAAALGVETLEMARIHERALVSLKLSVGKNRIVKRAELFFTEAITPILETHRAARQSRGDLIRMSGALDRRTRELAATNRQLQRGIVRRRSVEQALKNCGEHYALLLKDSLLLQEGLRQLTRQLLSAQGKEREKISRELQDEIAQTLLGINVRLLSLKQESSANKASLKNEIASTRRLVLKSARSVRRTALQIKNA